jgi:hypothetical protein
LRSVEQAHLDTSVPGWDHERPDLQGDHPMRLPSLLLRFVVFCYATAMADLICILLLWPRYLAGGYLLLLSSQIALVTLDRGSH